MSNSSVRNVGAAKPAARRRLWQRLFAGEAPAPLREGVPRLGRYRLLDKLGAGGMGTVFAAEDELLHRRVALKCLKRTGQEARRRFWREARAGARLSHPNICQLFEVGEHEGRLFLAMELLSGEPLSARLQRGPMPVEDVLSLGREILAALGALHAEGIVHRDLKPSNIFLTPHGAKILDFGLARPLPRELSRGLDTVTGITRPGMIVGSPRYMAPEQILGCAIDVRADLFAAGAVLYEALAGRPAFPGDDAVRILSATLHDPPAPLAGPPSLLATEAVVRRALAKLPEERFASAAEMMAALQGAAAAPTAPRGPARAGQAAAMPEPFVARDSELAWLEERLEAAVGGVGCVAFVTGERGVGKTALLGEFLRRVRSGPTPITVVAGRCVEQHGPGEAFLPFLDAMGRLLSSRARERAVELLRTWAPTAAVQFPTALVPDPGGELRRQTAGATQERLIRESGDFMEAAAREFPVVLLEEDLHWAGPSSVEMLHHLGRRIARQRILILGTLRHSDVDAGNAPLKRCVLDLLAQGLGRELAVLPFASSDVASYLAARFPTNAFPDALATALHARTDGLPLFLRSLVGRLLERGDIVRRGEVWELARPLPEIDLEPSKDLKELLRAEIEALPGADREMLMHASVAGREFLGPVVAAMLHADAIEIEERLSALGRVGRVIRSLGDTELPDGTLAGQYRFVHGFYQALLYEDLVAPRRARLHLQVGERLRGHWGGEAPSHAVELAEHFERGRDFAAAVEFRRHAGDNAARLFAYAEAAAHYSWAIRTLDKLPPDEGARHAIVLHRKRGAVNHALARFDAAIEDFERMLGHARETGAAAAECAAQCDLANALFFAQRVDEASVSALKALAAGIRARDHGLSLEARGRALQVFVGEGRLDEAALDLEVLVEAARDAGSRLALQLGLVYRGFVHYWQTEYEAARDCLAEAATLAAERGDGFETLGARMLVGLCKANLGRVSEALADFEDTIALARRNGDAFWLPWLVNGQGWVYREMMASERARDLDAAALQLARKGPSAWAPETGALINLCVDGVREGDVDQASARLAELEALSRRSRWFGWMHELRFEAAAAEHWAARGQWTKALEHALRLASVAERLNARSYRCAAERVRAEAALGRGTGLEEAVSRLGAALAELDRFPAVWETWRSGRLLARLHHDLGAHHDAREAASVAARAIRTIAEGTADEGLRAGFLSSAAVREVLEALPAGSASPARSS